jgi:hypothetical protein
MPINSYEHHDQLNYTIESPRAIDQWIVPSGGVWAHLTGRMSALIIEFANW